MKSAQQQSDSERSGLDLIEEASHLLRAAPAATLAIYYTGAVPFVLGFLYFWVDMGSNPYASRHLEEAALVLTALFFWMKLCQTLFAHRIRAQLAAKPMPTWTLKQATRVLFSQLLIHASGLFVIPVALVVMIPFAWIYSFYQSVTVLAGPDSADSAKLAARSWRQASLWVWQNHVVVGIGGLFTLAVLLNLALVSFSLPGLVKMLLGIETTFSRNPVAMLNTTFLGALLALTYLCADPLMKAIYTLRCFYGESLQSGEDLKADLKQFEAAPRYLAGALLLLLCLSSGASAGTPQNPTTSPSVSAGRLDQQIDKVIHQSKYAWRMPRENANLESAQKGMIGRFLDRVGTMARDGINAIARWFERIIRRVFGDGGPRGSGFGWMRSWLLLFLLLALVVSLLAVLLIRAWRQKRRPLETVAASAIQGTPDVTDESISADQLPEDGWTRLARELLEKGELRLAMRAFYLASLAHLARRNLVGIARFKSNRDYQNELRRRGHSVPGLLDLFGENLFTFERIWYGAHAVDRELVAQFAGNVERIRTSA